MWLSWSTLSICPITTKTHEPIESGPFGSSRDEFILLSMPSFFVAVYMVSFVDDSIPVLSTAVYLAGAKSGGRRRIKERGTRGKRSTPG